jgi:hypothetical protein
MLSGLERKTGWSLAEHAGEARPDGMQRLFTTARWNADGVRDDVRGCVAAALGRSKCQHSQHPQGRHRILSATPRDFVGETGRLMAEHEVTHRAAAARGKRLRCACGCSRE